MMALALLTGIIVGSLGVLAYLAMQRRAKERAEASIYGR